jgi:NOL1/NOP2/fmu family ribosome biogenesis protein
MLVQGFLAVIFIGFLLNKFYFRGRKCTSKAQLDNKTVIVTGANTGIGFETVNKEVLLN